MQRFSEWLNLGIFRVLFGECHQDAHRRARLKEFETTAVAAAIGGAEYHILLFHPDIQFRQEHTRAFGRSWQV